MKIAYSYSMFMHATLCTLAFSSMGRFYVLCLDSIAFYVEWQNLRAKGMINLKNMQNMEFANIMIVVFLRLENISTTTIIMINATLSYDYYLFSKNATSYNCCFRRSNINIWLHFWCFYYWCNNHQLSLTSI